MHDAVVAERLGIPAMAVMTTQFISAAELMCRVLGLPEYKFGVIEHPISSADDAALAVQARSTMEDVVNFLLRPQI